MARHGKTVSEHIRQRLLAAVPDPPKPQPSVADIVAEDWSWGFIQHCINYVVFGRFRYGKVKDCGRRFDRIHGMKQRIALYEKTGNTEYLIDVANMAQFEFESPSIAGACFKSTDDGTHFQLKAHA